MAGRVAEVPRLSLRELNRALLARQMLLERRRVGVVKSIEDLAGLQAQWAPSPYVALWPRIEGFRRRDLTGAIDRRQVVKTTVMRATLHLVSAREYPAYHRATLEGRFGAWRPQGAPSLAALEKMHARVLRLSARTPRSRKEIEAVIASESPKDPRMRTWLLWAAITTANGLLWDPPGAHFEHRAGARFVAPSASLRREISDEEACDLVVRRHLGAFGPATVQDVAAWSKIRVPLIRASLARVKGLVRFTDDRGRDLYDLRSAPRPPAETLAPVRFLARFDAAILGHAAPERTRILPEPYRKNVIFSAEVWQTFLVDGFVAGRWTIAVTPQEAVIELKPFGALAKSARTALVDEGERLVRFYAPEARTHGVRD